jgi:hypothetical protein
MGAECRNVHGAPLSGELAQSEPQLHPVFGAIFRLKTQAFKILPYNPDSLNFDSLKRRL